MESKSENRNIVNYTEEYLNSPFLKENNWYRRRAVIRKMMKYPHDRVLEIGCGMFPLISYLNRNEYKKYTIVEPSTTFVKNVKNYISNNSLDEKVDIICDFFENAKKLSEYNFIICSSLLHEVSNPAKLLEDIFGVCNDETVVHINVPNAMSVHRLIAYYWGVLKIFIS